MAEIMLAWAAWAVMSVNRRVNNVKKTLQRRQYSEENEYHVFEQREKEDHVVQKAWR
jgi:hypothetical protein